MCVYDDARHALLPKGHQHPPADHRLETIRDVVGESGVEGHRERNIAEFGHAVGRISAGT
jgi:hypothetical protein